MIAYEVTAVVDEAIAAEFKSYMTNRHIPDLMATGCFASAELSVANGRYRFRYDAVDQAALDRYFEEHAARLRLDVIEHFPSGVELSREVWTIVAEFSAP
jgi:hypothetical protein